ncbi:F-box protein-like protein [Salvia divinorum]|uniref:F-box protein-like protein n=1 Tax=Salvia divinorum TaxID=28513 RepID=A0ABD1GX08_SALDI
MGRRSLKVFINVCKHWLSIISAQQFCHLHTLRHPKPQPSLIVRTHKLVPYSVAIQNSKILNSCNGLLLLLQPVHPVEYHVYNSTTKQSRTISLTDSEDFTKSLWASLQDRVC